MDAMIFPFVLVGAMSTVPEVAMQTDALPVAGDSRTSKPKAAATLTGEWGGLRSGLRDRGVDLTASYGSEAAWNPAGGDRQLVRETGQFVFGATLDAAKVVGIPGGTLQATVTFRRGKDLGADANLHVLELVQEVYGRGQTWRLTQFWYQQILAGGNFDVKLGRLTQGEDFATFSCQFMNLTFCGAPPGNIVGDYWYSWPISQWALRARVKHGPFYAMAGAYEVNPRNLDKTFVIGHFAGATGIIAPVEIGYTPSVGPAKMPGYYRIGGWYNTSRADDLSLDLNGNRRVVTGLAPLRHDGRYGIYAQFQQQLTGTADATAPDQPATHGLVVFLNLVQADRQTSAINNQVTAGLLYTGLFSIRSHDDFGFAAARTNVNRRSSEGLALIPNNKRPTAEYVAEIDYGIHATDWLVVRPNVQYVINPSGDSTNRRIVIVETKSNIVF